MRLAPNILNDQVDYLAMKLAGGSIAIYDGEAPGGPLSPITEFREPLVTLHFGNPAFSPAQDGKAVAKTLETSGVSIKGKATWARLTTMSGEVVVDMDVAAFDDEDAKFADIVMNETDLRRGDILTARSVVLRLPAV